MRYGLPFARLSEEMATWRCRVGGLAAPQMEVGVEGPSEEMKTCQKGTDF